MLEVCICADVQRDQGTPKSLRNSPNNNTGATQPELQNPTALQGVTPSPPNATAGNAGNAGDASTQQGANANGPLGSNAFDLSGANTSANTSQSLLGDTFPQGDAGLSDWLTGFPLGDTFDISQYLTDQDESEVMLA